MWLKHFSVKIIICKYEGFLLFLKINKVDDIDFAWWFFIEEYCVSDYCQISGFMCNNWKIVLGILICLVNFLIWISVNFGFKIINCCEFYYLIAFRIIYYKDSNNPFSSVYKGFYC